MVQFPEAPKPREVHRDLASVTLVLRVYYSNETEELLGALVEETSARESPLDDAVLVVPDERVARDLEIALARARGVGLLPRRLSLSDLLDDGTGKPFDASCYVGPVLGALLDPSVLASAELAPVKAYLLSVASRDAADGRRVRLAREVSRLFADYARRRPEVFDCWRAGLFVGDSEARSAEAWQKRLWHEAAARFDAAPETPRRAPGAVHLFGFSRLSRGEALALGRLANDAAVYVYASNPCREIWEAIAEPLSVEGSAGRRYERRGRDLGPGEVYSFSDPFRLSNPGEMAPLRLWGRPGRESLRLLNALTGCELVPRTRAPLGDTVLRQLQRDIVLREPERSAPPREAKGEDASVVFMECPSPRREVEAIAASIWELLAQDEARGAEVRADPLRLTEIAVLFPPAVADRYHPLVETVFRDMHQLPFHSVDLPSSSERAVAALADALLALPLTALEPADVLRVVDHPLVAGDRETSDLREWIAHCAREAATEAPERSGGAAAPAERESFPWEPGLSTLALAAFAGGEPPGDDGSAPKGRVLSAARRQSAAAFGLLVRSLLADARQARRLQMTLPAWSDFLEAFLRSYVDARSEPCRRVLRAYRTAVSDLSRIDLGRRKVPYRVAHDLLRPGIVPAMEAEREPRGEGVVVASFLPSRVLSFKVVFVAGLSEEAFPRRDETGPLHLVSPLRAGQVTVRDEDRYLFLQTLLSTRDRFFLSFVDRDALTGERLRPSSVLLELEDTLRRGYLSSGPATRRWPLVRHEDPRTYRVSPAAARERAARRLGEHLESLVGNDGRRDVSNLVNELPASVGALLGSVPQPPPARRETRDRLLSLSALRRFLECPLQGSVTFHCGEEQTDDALAEGPTRREAAAAYGDLLEGVAGTVELLADGEPERLALQLGASRIELVRDSRLEITSSGALLRVVSQPGERFHPERESIRGFLDHVFRCAREPDRGGGRVIVVNLAPGGDRTLHSFAFAPVGQAVAKRYLASLAEELVSRVHDYLFPCERVFLLKRSGPSRDELDLRATSSFRGPVAHPEDFSPPPDEEARALRERRFGLYFGSLVREEAS